MSLRHSFVSVSVFACGLVATSVGCGGGVDAETLCEKPDGCGKAPTAEEIQSCKESIKQCPDESDDFAACADGNFECVDEKSTLKQGKCESEFGALFVCALGNAQQQGSSQ